MRLSARSKTTGLFLTKAGRWTDRIQKARIFRDSMEALRVANEMNLWDLEIYHAFGESAEDNFDFTLPLSWS
jgi:hypothetical protein